MTFRFDPALSRASTIPSSYYNDASVLDEENRNIFRRTWQLVGRVEQVAERGRFFTATIAGEPLLIVRGDEGDTSGRYSPVRENGVHHFHGLYAAAMGLPRHAGG